jgi:hypothetical protein
MLVMKNKQHAFIKKVEIYSKVLTKQQRSTLIGQAKKGDIEAAERGLSKLLKRTNIVLN